MIKGYFIGDSPFVNASVSLPRMTTHQVIVPFLIDTGAHLSVLQAGVLTQVGIDPIHDLTGLPADTLHGFGGDAEYVRLRSLLTFDDDGDGMANYTVFLRASRTGNQAGLPSVIGTDFLLDFDFFMSRRTNRVELTLSNP